jgi:hypothetical protein
MSWIIIILLALILVALVTSNNGSALGVKKAILYVSIAAVIIVAWVGLIAVLLWSNSINHDSDWSNIATLAIGAFFPPLMVWLNRSAIRSAFDTDSKAAAKSALKYVGYFSLWLTAMIGFQLLQKEGLDETLLLSIMGVSALVLIAQSFARPQDVRRIWFGPKEPTSVWLEMDLARSEAYAKNQDIWEQESAEWNSKSENERELLLEIRRQRTEETEHQLQLLEERLNALNEAWRKRTFWSVGMCFWLATVIYSFSVIGTVWDMVYGYTLNTTFVAGRGWLAIVLIAFGAWVLIQAVFEGYQVLKEHISGQKSTK